MVADQLDCASRAAATHLPRPGGPGPGRGGARAACRRSSSPGKSRRCKAQIAEAQRGERFLLQGGDCAETFDDCDSGQIARKLKILLQMSLVLLHGMKKPVIRVGRFAGQYAKPRSADTETRDGVTLPCYRGDLVNRPGFTPAEREPDPELLLRGYERAALTLNFVRALIDGGFADLHHPEYWDLGFVKHSPLEGPVRADRGVDRRLARFLRGHERQPRARGEPRRRSTPATRRCTCTTSRRRRASSRASGRWYNLSTHLPWIGMRTADLDGAHVEYCRGISNPVGVKVGPSMDADWVQGLCRRAEPGQRARAAGADPSLGREERRAKLPALIEAVRATGVPVLWICDPMHGNTESTASGVKTRRFENILRELEAGFRVHRALGSYLGGVHFELTGEDVTECTGGARGLADADLARGLPVAGRPAAQLRAGARAGDADRDLRPGGLTAAGGRSRRAADSTASASVAGTSRHWPGSSPATVHGPMPQRISRRVGKPMAAVIRRTCRLRPSRSSSSIQAVGMALRTRIGGCRGQSPAGSSISRASAGRVGPSPSARPRRRGSSAASSGAPSTWTR